MESFQAILLLSWSQPAAAYAQVAAAAYTQVAANWYKQQQLMHVVYE
jgi:hypothetical protein